MISLSLAMELKEAGLVWQPELHDIMKAEVVWVPTESQLREMLQERLLAEEQPAVQLISAISGYHCQITYDGDLHEFEAATASDAYGQALLFLIQGGERWLGSSGMEA